jgi:TolB-like protein/Flp pilus assembly protein TadD
MSRATRVWLAPTRSGRWRGSGRSEAIWSIRRSRHHGRVIKRTGDGVLIEFRSVVDAVRCAMEVQNGMAERNAGPPSERRIEFRVGVHLGDVIEESDGDLMGDGVNIAARLEAIATPGTICLSEDAYRQVRDRLKEPFVDLGDQRLKNIARPLRAYAINCGEERPPSHTSISEKAPPPRLSIVVLPFVNLGGDSEQEYFVDGVTENLTTDLSRIAGAVVIARNTAFTYKGKPFDVKKIGRELNVRYALEGSVQRSGSRLRVNVQLIDADSGSHLWAERFDKSVADLFDLQDEIVARLANQLNARLVAIEARRAEKTPHADSMDLYFRGLATMNLGGAPANLQNARDLFERAVALDPANVDALIAMGQCDSYIGGGLFSSDRATRLASAEAALAKALSLVPSNPLAHFYMGHLQIFTNRGAQGIAELERALALDRNLVGAHGAIGLGKYTIGRGEETEAHIQEALRLSPYDVNAYLWIAFSGFAKLYLGQDEEAVSRLRQSVDANRNYPVAFFFLGAALARLGRRDEARDAVKAGLAIGPTFSIRRHHAGTMSEHPTYVMQRERIYDAMREAGVPQE